MPKNHKAKKQPKKKRNNKTKQRAKQPKKHHRKIVPRVVPLTNQPTSRSPNMFQSIGEKLGGTAGKWLGSLFGMGAYQVKKNSLLMADSGPAVFRPNSDGSIVVSHREFIADISGSTSFTNTSYNLNAGMAATFPWLSNVALNFEQYEFLGLVLEFKSTSAVAVNSTNTALGTVIMATEYDSMKPAFTSKQQMEAYQFCTSSSPSCSFYHPVECAPGQNVMQNLYIRSTSVPSGADPRFYDLGTFQLATSGMQAAAVIGELWISYHVKLLKPKLPTPLGQASNSISVIANCATGSAFGSTSPSQYGNMKMVFPTANSFTIPRPGAYIVAYYAYATTSYTNTLTISVSGTASFYTQVLYENTVSQNYVSTGSGGQRFSALCCINNTGNSGTVQFTAPNVVGSCNFNLFVYEVDADSYTMSTPLALLETVRLRGCHPSRRPSWIEVDEKEAKC